MRLARRIISSCERGAKSQTKGSEVIMLESCRNAQERWGGVHLLIDRWLQERHALITAFHELHTGVEPVTRPALQKFCQLLLDYVSAGHFEIYEQLIHEGEAFGD